MWRGGCKSIERKKGKDVKRENGAEERLGCDVERGLERYRKE